MRRFKARLTQRRKVGYYAMAANPKDPAPTPVPAQAGVDPDFPRAGSEAGVPAHMQASAEPHAERVLMAAGHHEALQAARNLDLSSSDLLDLIAQHGPAAAKIIKDLFNLIRKRRGG